MTMFDSPLTWILLLYIQIYLAVWWHELGHALLGRWNGFEVSSFGTGIAGPFFVVKCGRTRIYLCRKQPFQGLTFMFSAQIYPLTSQTVAALAGGVFANGCVALLALALWRYVPWGSALWRQAVLVNGSLALGNLLPYQFQVGRAFLNTDGAQILRHWQRRTPEGDPNSRLRHVAAIAPLLQAIGDTTALYHNLRVAVSAHLQLDDVEAARSVYAEIQALPEAETSLRRAENALLRSHIALHTKELAEAAGAWDEAENEFKALNHEVGLLLAQWTRAQLWILQQDMPPALDTLDALAAHPFFLSRPALQKSLLVTRLSASVVLGDRGRAGRLMAEYERLRVRAPSLASDLSVYKIMAHAYARAQDWQQAEPLYRKALDAVQRLLATFTDAEACARFGQRQSGLLEEYKNCLCQQGKEEEGHRLDTWLAALEAEQQKRDAAILKQSEAEQRRMRQHDRWSLLCILADSVIGAFGWLLVSRGELQTDTIRFIGVAGVLSLISAGINLAFFASNRNLPGLRRNGGYYALAFSLMPWVLSALLEAIVRT